MSLMVVLCFCTGVFADKKDMYVAGQYHRGGLDFLGEYTANPSAVGVVFGAYVQDKIAMEIRYAMGINSDSIYDGYDDYEFSIKNATSFFIKGDLPLNEKVVLYGLVGFTKFKSDVKTGGLAAEITDSGLSYGVGIEGKLADKWAVNAEFVNYLNEEYYDYTGMNFSLKRYL
jgi:opacity protein-like surface antigen